jgi:HEAT repeat protein
MFKTILELVTAVVVAAATTAACVGQPEQQLPPPDLERREQRLAEVRQQLEILATASVEDATALLDHEDHRVRRAAALCLAETGPEAAPALEELIGRLKDKHPRVQTAAARALGAIGDPAALDGLVAAMVDPDRDVRLWAWKAVRKHGDVAIPRLIFHLGQQSPILKRKYVDEVGTKHSIRMEIRYRMASLSETAIPPLIETMKGDDEWARVYAAHILGDMGEQAKGALPDVIAVIDHEDYHLRRAAAIALGDIGDLDPGVVPALRRAAKDKNSKVKSSAKKSLKKIERAAAKKKKEEKGKKDKAKRAKGKKPRPSPKKANPKAGVGPSPAKQPAGADKK